MIQIGDLFIRKDQPGAYLLPVITIAKDETGTNLYEIAGCGYYTATQLHQEFNNVTVLKEEQCNLEA